MMVTPELPKLRSDLRHSRQETTGGAAFVLKDPVTGRFFRFREAEQFIAQQLDGTTPLEVIGQRAEAHFGKSCPTDALKGFVDRLQRLGLLESQAAPRQTSWTASGRVRGDVFYLRLKAFDPDSFLTWLLPKLQFCFTSAFLVCSTVLILFAFGLTLLNGAEIQRDAANLYRMETFILIWLTILVIDFLHELAHGLTCKRFGGEVHELGFMLLYFQPAFYCNVSDAWLFTRKSHRLWVTFAGVYSELCISAVAALIWRLTEPGNWVHAVALVIVGTSGIRTFFNFNPLIKLDGYYLLSDALEIPNLRMRSFRYLQAMIVHALFPGPRWAAQVVQEARPRERKIYLTYSLLAGLFSAWLLGSIAWWVGSSLVQRYQGTGFLLFTGLLVAVSRRPLIRFLRTVMGWLRTAPVRIASMKRPIKSALLLVVVAAVLFLGRMELTISGEFTVLPIQNADVRAEVEGLIAAVFVEEGDRVRQGDPIATLSDRDYRAEFNKTTAEIQEKQAKLRMLRVGPRPEEIEVARKVVVTAKTRQEQAHKRYDEAIKLRAERQARAEATVDKSKERVKYAQQNFEGFKTLSEEEIEGARKAVATGKTRQEQARKRYDEAIKLRAERQARAEATVEKAKERVKYAQQNFERFKTLFEQDFISHKDLDDVEEQMILRGKELEEAQASLKLVLYDDLADFQKEMAVTEKELDEAQGKLRVLLAGSRKEVIGVEEQMTVRGREVEEAEASLNQVLYDDLADFQKEMAVTEKELDEALGRLSVLLAGSRKEEIEATEAEIGRLKAQQQLLEEQLRLMRVVSPHAGVITTPRMKEKVGQLVSKGTLIAEVHDLSTIEAETAVPEQEIADVQVGRPVVLKARSYPTESFEGTVTAIAPAAVRPDEAIDQKIIRVITKIDNASLLLKSQMTGNAKIYSGKRSIAELLTRRFVRYLRVEFWAWW